MLVVQARYNRPWWWRRGESHRPRRPRLRAQQRDLLVPAEATDQFPGLGVYPGLVAQWGRGQSVAEAVLGVA